MAILEHGLPVIVNRRAGRYRDCPDQLLEPALENVITDFDLAAGRKIEPRQRLPHIAEQFIADLRAG
jgi:hypothetical protein